MALLRSQKRPSLLEQLKDDPQAAERIRERMAQFNAEADEKMKQWRIAQGVKPSPHRYGSFKIRPGG